VIVEDLQQLKAFVETLKLREDDHLATVTLRLDHLRQLTKDIPAK
jgi:hypothetical protein